MVFFALPLENRPVDTAANPNAEETTTKVIRTMAVSRPVIPFGQFAVFRAIQNAWIAPAELNSLDLTKLNFAGINKH